MIVDTTRTGEEWVIHKDASIRGGNRPLTVRARDSRHAIMTELTGVPIPAINWQSGNLPEALRKFKRTCEYIFNGPLATKDEAIKVQCLMYFCYWG